MRPDVGAEVWTGAMVLASWLDDAVSGDNKLVAGSGIGPVTSGS